MQKEIKKDVNKNVMLNLFQHLPRTVVSQQPQQALKTLNQVQGDLIINNHAFTLIELLVVVLIIGILAAIALPKYELAVMKTRYATMKNLVNSMYQAEKIYYLANNEYTTDFDNLDINIGTKGSGKTHTLPWGYCTLESSYVYCFNTQLNMAYYINFRDERFCLTYDNEKQYPLRHQLCQQETGKTAADMDGYGAYVY